MDNSRRNQGKRETFASIVNKIGGEKSLLLIVEDVHWADKLVLEHLSELSKALSEVPVVLMMTSRIEGDQIDDAWRLTTGSTPLLTIDLRPLRHADAIALASEFFDASDKFANSCVVRADGNPLFLEQLLRGAEAASEESVPGSVQSIVQARVDALDSPEKMAMQAAAILGQRFSLDALQHMIENDNYDCEALIKRHLIRPAGDAYLFAHALVRDGVYNSLLKANRSKLHIKAASWYWERDPGLYAQHLDRAGDAAAPRAYLRAAKVQTDALSFESTITLCKRGLELAVETEDVCLLNIALGNALLSTRATEQAIEVFETAAQSAFDDHSKCTALSGLAAALRIADRQEPAFLALDEAQKLATRNSLSPELAYIHYLRGNLCFPLGRIDECMAEHEKSLKFAEEIRSPEAQARALSGLADAHYLRGHMSTACERFKTCVELCQEHGFGQIEVANRHMIGWSRIHLMEFSEALKDAEDSEAMAKDVRNNRALMFAKGLAGTVKNQLGDLEGAEKYLLDAAELAKSMSSSNHVAQVLRTLALIRRKQGRIEDAQKLACEALSTVREVGMNFIGPTVLCTYAVLCDDEEERLQLLQEAESILDTECVAHNQLWFADIAIDDAASRGDWPSALRFADRLERFTRSQPLPWSVFMVRRARTLEEAHRVEKNKALSTELRELKHQAELAGLTTAVPALERALAYAN
ncbi:MAG: ATP-binding protein [Hyphomicrobiales bacterium]